MLSLVVVLRVPYVYGNTMEVHLSCGEAYQNQPVFWKKEGNNSLFAAVYTHTCF